MTHEWPIVPLGEVMSQFQDYIDSPEPRIYPKLSVKLYGRGVALDEPADGATLLMKRHQIAKSGQVILSEIWGKKGAIGFVPPEGEGALCTSHFFLFDVHTDKIDPKWLQAIFTANYLQDQLDAEAKGTTGYAAVRPKNLLAATIPLPPLDEQRRLIARIEALATKIEEARGLRRLAVEEAEALVPAAMKGCFDFGASTREVGDFASVLGGYAFASDQYVEDGEYQVIRIGNVRDGYLDLSRMPVYWNRVDDERAQKYELREGDIVISMTGTRTKRDYGYVAVVPGGFRLLVNQRVGKIVLHKPIDPRYLYHFLRSPFFRDRLFPFATGTANQGNIGNKHIEQVSFDPPESLEKQHRIAAYLDDLQARVDVLKQLQAHTQAELDALLPSVLDRAFKGELL